MNDKARLAVTVIAALLVAACTRDGEISGVVTDFDTGKPIPSMPISLKQTSSLGRHTEIDRTITDQSGRYRFTTRQAGWLMIDLEPNRCEWSSYRHPVQRDGKERLLVVDLATRHLGKC